MDKSERATSAAAGRDPRNDQLGGSIIHLDTPPTAPAQGQAYAFHPLADIFPLLEGDEFEDLVADIKANGLIEPIILLDDLILDGRNRYRACIAAGIEPTYRPFIGDDFAAFVISMNVARRHLTHGQKRAVLVKLLAAHPEKSDRQIAETVKASPTTVGVVRSQMESTVQIGQLPKRIGKDGKARKRPQSRTARRQARIDRAMGRHSRPPPELANAATDNFLDDDGDYAPVDPASDASTRIRGFLYRAHQSERGASLDDLDGLTITQEMRDAGARAASAWTRICQLMAAEPTTAVVADALDDIPDVVDQTGGRI
jgi:ParB-like chromosome segregation protein Spo0J